MKIRVRLAAASVIALACAAGCGAAGATRVLDADGITAAGPAIGVNGPFGTGGPFAGRAAPAPGTAPGPGTTAGPGGSSSGTPVDGSTALEGVHSVSWLSALGAGVSVSAPQTVRPGTDSPADAEAGFYDAYYARRYAVACDYADPAQRALCLTVLPASSASAGALRHAAIGFVAVKDTKAIVTMTGLVCGQHGGAGNCLGQYDSGWIFGGSRSFTVLWSLVTAEGGNPLTATPLIRVASQWYVDLGDAGD